MRGSRPGILVKNLSPSIEVLDIAANHQDWHFYLHFFQLHF